MGSTYSLVVPSTEVNQFSVAVFAGGRPVKDPDPVTALATG